MPITAAPTREMSAAQARRIAIAAQQLAAPAPLDGQINRGHLRRLMQRLGVLQIDSVNVLVRAHYLPVFARLGSYPMKVLADAAWPARTKDRTLVEVWAHEASLVPAELHPLLRWQRRHWSNRMADRINRDQPGLLDSILTLLADEGPLSAGEVEDRVSTGQKGKAGWWEWSATKRACEALFAAGSIGTADRRGFERRYDLIDRVLPPAILAVPVPAPEDARRQLAEISARAHGVGTAKDLADYYRMPVAETKAALADLVADGVLEQVSVAGWRDVGYLHRDARIPRRVDGQALVCPFDPLVWERDRTERIFDIRYRIEIYTPAPKRVYGYYVLPFLLGDRIVGRFDLKADRQGGALLVQASWLEPFDDKSPAEVAAAAAVELRRMADWLELDSVRVVEHGNFHAPIRQALGR